MLNQSSTPVITILPAHLRTPPKEIVRENTLVKNFDPDGEMNENFYRDKTQLESDANYFGSPEDMQ